MVGMEVGEENALYVSERVSHPAHVAQAVGAGINHEQLLAGYYRDAGTGSVGRRHGAAGTAQGQVQPILECLDDIRAHAGFQPLFHHAREDGFPLAVGEQAEGCDGNNYDRFFHPGFTL
jgi:hypothetical protein